MRVHAVLCQWIEWFEAQEATDLAAVASDNETIPGIPFTSQDKTAQRQLDNEDDDDAKDTQPGTQEMLNTEEGALEVVPRPFWTLERKAEAEASVQKFVDLTNRVFAGQATRSLKFTCLSLVTDALEVATRLKNFLGKDHPPVPIELLAKPGQWQAPLGQQSTTTGNESNVVLRVHFPRKMSARTGKGACASVQVNMCRGQPGARSVTVKGASNAFRTSVPIGS